MKKKELTIRCRDDTFIIFWVKKGCRSMILPHILYFCFQKERENGRKKFFTFKGSKWKGNKTSLVLLKWDKEVREAPAQEKHGSNGLCPNSFSTPPTLKQTDALWELFSPKICQFFKTAVSTLEMDILTITMVKLCS